MSDRKIMTRTAEAKHLPDMTPVVAAEKISSTEIREQEIIKNLQSQAKEIIDSWMGDPKKNGSHCPLTYGEDGDDLLIPESKRTGITTDFFLSYYQEEIIEFVSEHIGLIKADSLPECLVAFQESRLRKAPGPHWDSCVSQLWKQIVDATVAAQREIKELEALEASKASKATPAASANHRLGLAGGAATVSVNGANNGSHLNAHAVSFRPGRR